ncbi:hypothetical protein [Archangium sp.]|uniref:hypothetical protein n=1 Tax=Archangium sp. TaxID=1872627 RepID=UPI003899F0CA
MTPRLVHVVLTLVLAAGTEEYRKNDPPRAHARATRGSVTDTANPRKSQKGKVMNESMKPPSRRSPECSGLSRVLVAMTGTCLIAGCAGVRVLPDGTAACSPEAIAETQRMHIPQTSYFSVEVLGLPGSVGDVALIQEGPIEVRLTSPVHDYVPFEIANSPLCTDHPANWVVPSDCKGKTLVTDTALLYGEASFKDDRVQIRLHQLRDLGRIGPFCGVIAQRRSLSMVGLQKNPPEALRMLGLEQPPPGTVAVWSDAEVLIVEDESQKPKLE